jgi:hypothetical protein
MEEVQIYAFFGEITKRKLLTKALIKIHWMQFIKVQLST